MRTVQKALTIAFFSTIFAGMGLTSQAQTATTSVTIINNTGCQMLVVLEGWTGSNCNGIKVGGQNVIAANSTGTVTWTNPGTVSAYFSDGSSKVTGNPNITSAALDLCNSNVRQGVNCASGNFNMVYSSTASSQTITIQ